MSKAAARGLSFLSMHSNYIQKPHDWVMESNAPSYTPVTWQVASHDVESVDDWAVFVGDPAAGVIPRWYREGAIVNIEREALDDLQQREGGRHAAAYALGSMIMVGELPNGFGHEMTDEDRYAVGMRIGKGTLMMTAGLWLPEDRRLLVPADSLHRMETAPVYRFPVNIPLI